MSAEWQVVSPVPCELGESPFWHPAQQMLYWVDIPAKKILRADVLQGRVETWHMPLEPGCMAPAATGGLVIALRDGIYRAHEWGGALTLLQPCLHDPATSRFNDGKADPMGRFWAGTIYEPRTAPKAELFVLQSQHGHAGALQRMAGDATVANGLAWSPDARTLYWADTTAHVVRAWDWDASANTMRAPRVFQSFPSKPDGWAYGSTQAYGGRPDGAAVDVQGNYYVAMFEGRRIAKFSPAGELLASLPTPAQCPTMPCFGGPDLQTLFITTARHGRSAQELADMPQSGCVFAMRVDVPGLPVQFFRD